MPFDSPYPSTYPTAYGFGPPGSTPGTTRYQPQAPGMRPYSPYSADASGYTDMSRPQPFAPISQSWMKGSNVPGGEGSPEHGPRDTTYGGVLRERLQQLQSPSRIASPGEMFSETLSGSPFLKAFGYGGNQPASPPPPSTGPPSGGPLGFGGGSPSPMQPPAQATGGAPQAPPIGGGTGQEGMSKPGGGAEGLASIMKLIAMFA